MGAPVRAPGRRTHGAGAVAALLFLVAAPLLAAPLVASVKTFGSFALGRRKAEAADKRTPGRGAQGSATTATPVGEVRGPVTASQALAMGVPEDIAAGVAELSQQVRDLDSDLTHPLMLARFMTYLRNVTQAEAMVRKSHAWRKEVNVEGIMQEWGEKEEQLEGAWHRKPQSERAALADKHFCGGRIKGFSHSGAPVVVARFGKCDVPGMAREGLGDLMLYQFIFTLEEVLRTAHAASVAGNTLAMASIVIDISDFSASVLRHLEVPKRFAFVMNEYYPDIAATISIVNAPFMFESIWKVVSLLLDPSSREKVSIMGKNFGGKLAEHGNLDLDILPPFLGGKASESELPAALPVPAQAGAGMDLSFSR